TPAPIRGEPEVVERVRGNPATPDAPLVRRREEPGRVHDCLAGVPECRPPVSPLPQLVLADRLSGEVAEHITHLTVVDAPVLRPRVLIGLEGAFHVPLE